MAQPRTRKSSPIATAEVANPTVSENDIARRAYDLYLSRGGEDGHDIDDWLRAERELRETSPFVTS